MLGHVIFFGFYSDADALLEVVHDSPGYGMGKRRKSVSQGLRRLASFNYGDPSVYM